MFYAILPAAPAVFLVQPDAPDLSEARRAELLVALLRHFMSAVSLVWWDAEGLFHAFGHPCTEAQASGEELQWREFALPVRSDELPF